MQRKSAPQRFKKFTISHRNEDFCLDCLKFHDILKYNPYYDAIKAFSEDIEKFYLNNHTHEDALDTICPLNEILENCSVYSIEEFNKIPLLKNQINKFSFKFLNIDGNLSTFDTFLSTISVFKQQFTILGIAETNISPGYKELYRIPVYQKTVSNKKKGTGVALYIHETLNFSANDAISLCTEFIESLFATINIGKTEIAVGVIYRPPSGNVAKFNEAIYEILSSSEVKRNVIIMGDFNINMFTNAKQQLVFEENVSCNGFTPTIAVATHKKPNCQPSCIDNILVNSADNVIKSGAIETYISHHRSLFIRISVPANNNVKKSVNKIKSDTLKYDFNVENLDKLNKLIIENLNSCDIDNFEKFTTSFLNCMDSACKRNTSTSTKRNRIQNRMITSSLILSISKRDRLYKKWKRSTSKLCTSVDPQLFEEYCKHRNKISYQIKESKRLYFKLRFENASGNLKQT